MILFQDYKHNDTGMPLIFTNFQIMTCLLIDLLLFIICGEIIIWIHNQYHDEILCTPGV